MILFYDNFNDRNFTIIREQYQQQCGGLFPEVRDEHAIDEVVRQLKIKINTTESHELLYGCALSSCAEDSQKLVKAMLD